jgi:hypothetical protein
VSEPPQKKTGAARMIKHRRNAGVPARYFPEMQFTMLLKELKADFNVFENEIEPDGVANFDFFEDATEPYTFKFNEDQTK